MNRIPALALVLLFLATCRTSQDRQLHTAKGSDASIKTSIDALESPAVQRSVQNASIERHPDFTLGIIEFDDEGLSFSADQRRRVAEEMKSAVGKDGAIIVAFIHGWRHNAAVCDGNLACFRRVLQSLANQEKGATGRQPRQVVGLYLAWRGLSYCTQPATILSNWTRRRIGERLGNLYAREVIRDVIRLYNTDKHPDTRLVIAGHSFGGGVLFSAVAPFYRQALRDAIAATPEDGTAEAITGYTDLTNERVLFPDLIVLANPAFDAELYRGIPEDLKKMEETGRQFSGEQSRLMVMVSSKGDWATRFIFPVGQTTRLLFSPAQWIRGPGFLYRSSITAANKSSYITDRARRITEEQHRFADDSARRRRRPTNCFEGDFERLTGEGCGCSELTELDQMLAPSRYQTYVNDERRYGNVLLTPARPGIDPRNPFMVVEAAKDVIANHNDIYNPTFMSMLIDLIRRVDAEKYNQKREQ